MMPSHYPLAVDPVKVGEYPAEAKSGGGYFYDEVLEYRVWCRPWLGAPDEFNGNVYYYAFDSFEAAKAFADGTQGAEQPLVLVRQYEWIDEPTPGHLIPMKGERITEWAVDWLQGSKRAEQSISEFIEAGVGL